MTLEQLYQLLISSGIKFAYHHWDKPPPFPYGVYLLAYTRNLPADGAAYQKINHYQVELYSIKKEPEAEMMLENTFDASGIFYDKTEEYIESEKIYQIIYEIEV